MPKRTLAVLGVAAFAGLALPFGLPQMAQAAGPIASISLMPFPIAQPGTLNTPATSVNICVQPRNSSNQPVGVGTPVWLSFFPGVFTAPTVKTSTAFAGATQLTATPASFLTVASCTSQNGTISADSVAVTYTSPTSPIPAHGRDLLDAADTSAQPDTTTGACPGTNICNSDTYVYSPVTQYIFNPAPPIAPNGSLAAGTVVPFTVTAEDLGGHTVPGAFIVLSLNSTQSPHGTATGVNHFSGFTNPITNTPNRFGSDGAGAVQIAYTATSTTSGTDTITAQDHPLTPTVTATTSYTYGPGSTFSQAPYTALTPFRICDTRPAGSGIAANQCNAPGKGAIGAGQIRAVTVTGGLVPSTATAIVVNLTAIAPTTGTFVKLFPAGGTSSTSNVNPQAGEVIANLAEVAIGPAGVIDVYNALGTINVALDVEGYVDSTSLGFFHSTVPTRICDTRAVAQGIGPNQCNIGGTHPIGGGGVLNFNVTSSGSPIPSSGVTAVVFNLTAIGPSARTVLKAYPGPISSAKPNVSNININPGQAIPNRVIVAVPSGCTTACTVNIWNAVGSVNVAVDVDGWFGTASAAQFTALTPARVCDTQSGTPSDDGCNQAMIPAGGTLNINVTGIDGIPLLGSAHSPIAIVVNVTAVNATSSTFVTVYPGLIGRPNASDLNAPSFQPVTNLVVVGVGTDGRINLFNAAGNVNLIVDVFGYYS